MIDGQLFTIAPGESFPVTLGFGEVTPETAQYGPHTGIDVGAPLGSALDALLGGTVSAVRTENLGGLEVQVTAPSGESVLFAHLSEADVQPGEVVTPETLIGYTGMSGSAVTGPHVHIETRNAGGSLVDPLSVLGGAPASSTPTCPAGQVLGPDGVTCGYVGRGGFIPADNQPQPAGGVAGAGRPGSGGSIAGIPGAQDTLTAAGRGAAANPLDAIGGAIGNGVAAIAVIVVVLVLVVAGGRRVIGE